MTSLDLVFTEDTSPTGDWCMADEGGSISEEFAADEDYMPEAQSRPRQQPGSACEECRRRKSRCDRKQPTCAACASAGVVCIFRKTCPPRGPKKGHLRALRGQIAALETRLNEQENKDAVSGVSGQTKSCNSISEPKDGSSNGSAPMSALTPYSSDLPIWFAATSMATPMPPVVRMDSIDALPSGSITPSLDPVPIGLHLTTLVCTDLDQLYFGRIHAFVPMLQKFRYLSWSNQPHKSTQKICLQYSMWALAACLSSQFQFIRDGLYKEARQMLEALEMGSEGTNKRSIEQVQAWILLSIYEFLCDYYERGLVSVGRAFRLAQIMRLYDIDSHMTSPVDGGADWIDVESMRRTFWIAYTIDRFTATYEGLSLSFDEHDIRTRLPAPDAQFMSGRPLTMPFLTEVFDSSPESRPSEEAFSAADSPLMKTIVVATICGRTLFHKQKSAMEQTSHDASDDFVHRDEELTMLLGSRIEAFTLEITSNAQHPDPNLLFATMTAHVVVLQLYEIMKSMPLRTRKLHTLLLEHKQRSLDAARALSNLATVLTQLNSFEIHPLTPIPLLLGIRFCQVHMGASDAYRSSFPLMEKALHGLTSVNSLAKNSLQLLGRTMMDVI